MTLESFLFQTHELCISIFSRYKEAVDSSNTQPAEDTVLSSSFLISKSISIKTKRTKPKQNSKVKLTQPAESTVLFFFLVFSYKESIFIKTKKNKTKTKQQGIWQSVPFEARKGRALGGLGKGSVFTAAIELIHGQGKL